MHPIGGSDARAMYRTAVRGIRDTAAQRVQDLLSSPAAWARTCRTATVKGTPAVQSLHPWCPACHAHDTKEPDRCRFQTLSLPSSLRVADGFRCRTETTGTMQTAG